MLKIAKARTTYLNKKLKDITIKDEVAITKKLVQKSPVYAEISVYKGLDRNVDMKFIRQTQGTLFDTNGQLTQDGFKEKLGNYVVALFQTKPSKSPINIDTINVADLDNITVKDYMMCLLEFLQSKDQKIERLRTGKEFGVSILRAPRAIIENMKKLFDNKIKNNI